MHAFSIPDCDGMTQIVFHERQFTVKMVLRTEERD